MVISKKKNTQFRIIAHIDTEKAHWRTAFWSRRTAWRCATWKIGCWIIWTWARARHHH